MTCDHSRYEGGIERNVTRLVFERGDSAAALLHDPGRDIVLLTEQFRMPTYEKGPGWLLEVAAGTVEPSETPDACIIRELREEIGYEVDAVELIARFYVSPGGTSERIFLYYASVSANMLKDHAASGVASQQEDVKRVEIPTREFLDMAARHQIEDAKTLIAALWLHLRISE